MMKGSIQGEDTTIINIYAPNIGALQYIRQMLTAIKGEINNNTIIVGDCNTPLTAMDRPSRQEINKEIVALNDTLDKMNTHSTRAKYTFFSSTLELSPGYVTC